MNNMKNNQRIFKHLPAAIIPAAIIIVAMLLAAGTSLSVVERNSAQIFSEIVSKSKAEAWDSLPVGLITVKCGLQFLGTPYIGGTLEGSGPEVCRIDLNGLDCVTFFENSLCMARVIKKKEYTYDGLIKEITFTRYRNGKITGYASRLHYTADWIADNVRKGVVEDITKEIGGERVKFDVSFMSEHPESYPGLSGNKELIREIAGIEREINSRPYYYIPKSKVKQAEKFIRSGDIICFTTNIPGLDYSHVGLAYEDKGEIKLLHASLTHKRVIIDKPLHQYIAGVKKHTGITVLRPVDVVPVSR